MTGRGAGGRFPRLPPVLQARRTPGTEMPRTAYHAPDSDNDSTPLAPAPGAAAARTPGWRERFTTGTQPGSGLPAATGPRPRAQRWGPRGRGSPGAGVGEGGRTAPRARSPGVPRAAPPAPATPGPAAHPSPGADTHQPRGPRGEGAGARGPAPPQPCFSPPIPYLARRRERARRLRGGSRAAARSRRARGPTKAARARRPPRARRPGPAAPSH